MNRFLPMARNENIVVQELEKELLLYDLEKNKAICLNETSALVWESCDGKKSVAEISRLMTKKLKMNVPEEFVWLALDGLKRNGLLENSKELEVSFGGLTRRQVVRRVGVASMIALPLISSVVAPQAFQAQSGGGPSVPLGGSCSAGQTCEPGNSCLTLPTGSGPQQFCCLPGAMFAPGNDFGCLFPAACSSITECCSGVIGQGGSFGCPIGFSFPRCICI